MVPPAQSVSRRQGVRSVGDTESQPCESSYILLQHPTSPHVSSPPQLSPLCPLAWALKKKKTLSGSFPKYANFSCYTTGTWTEELGGGKECFYFFFRDTEGWLTYHGFCLVRAQKPRKQQIRAANVLLWGQLWMPIIGIKLHKVKQYPVGSTMEASLFCFYTLHLKHCI